jgi:hypothetical protein
MPGSIHLPGWVGLLLERRRTGLRVESLTPWQSSVSAGIHCCTNPYHAKRNGVNSIWHPAPRSRKSREPLPNPQNFRRRHVSQQTQRPPAGPPNQNELSLAADPKFRARAAQAPAAHKASAGSSSLSPAHCAAVPFRDCTPSQISLEHLPFLR